MVSQKKNHTHAKKGVETEDIWEEWLSDPEALGSTRVRLTLISARPSPVTMKKLKSAKIAVEVATSNILNEWPATKCPLATSIPVLYL